MKLSRREALKAASVGLAMPWLSTVARAQANAGEAPKRVFIFLDPYGRFGTQTNSSVTAAAPWIRSDSGDYRLRPEDLGWMLSPLESQMDNLSVLSGVFMRSRTQLGGGISHPQVNSYALTGSRVTGNIRSNATVCAHPSINNFIGDQLNAAAASKSIYNSLSIGASGQYNYGTDGTRAGGLGTPKAIYDTAFGMGEAPDTRAITAQRSVVEQVRRQIVEIAPELVQANAATVMDAYRSSIESIASELEIRAQGSCDRMPANVLDRSTGQDGFTQMINATYDLFSCGLTPSVFYAYSHTGPHPFLADADLIGDDGNRHITSGQYHRISHENNEVAGAAQGVVMRNQIAQIGRLADMLSETPELDNSGDMMMDNTVILYHQSMSRNTHGTLTPYYHFLLSGANTNVNRGWHFDCSDNSDNELFTTLAQAVGLPVTQFGGYQGTQFRGQMLNRGPISKVLKQMLGA